MFKLGGKSYSTQTIWRAQAVERQSKQQQRVTPSLLLAPKFSGEKPAGEKPDDRSARSWLKAAVFAIASLAGALSTPLIFPPPLEKAIAADAPSSAPLQSQSLSPAERAELAQLLSRFQVKEKSYRFFEEARHPQTGMVLDRLPLNRAAGPQEKENTMASISTTGYSLAMDVLKARDGFLVGCHSPATAQKVVAKRLHQTLDFVETLSKPENGYFLPHFFHWENGTSVAEISTVDTAIFYLGAIAAAEFCGGESLERVERMFNRLDFNMMRTRNHHPDFLDSANLSHGLDPEHRFIPYHWGGPYSEGVHLLNLLALAQPSVPSTVWNKGWDREKNWKQGDLSTYTETPLFTYFYGHGLLPLKGMKDSHGEDYWAESQKAVLMQLDYCEKKGYPAGLFGLTACDAPPPIGYRAYHPNNDDGTIAPPAIIASLPFAEKTVLKAMRQLEALGLMESPYGPVNAYNVFTEWKAPDALGIDIASMMLMLDAYENGTIHKLTSQNRLLQRAYRRAGLTPVQE